MGKHKSLTFMLTHVRKPRAAFTARASLLRDALAVKAARALSPSYNKNEGGDPGPPSSSPTLLRLHSGH